MRRIPKPPLGKYPQWALCGHIGSTPTSIKIKTIRRMAEIFTGMPFRSADRESNRMPMQVDKTDNSAE
jgi:hypothetical protein